MKYKYTGKVNDSLRQIIATKDFGNVKKGQIGGYIEKYSNLDQTDDSWIDENSSVQGNSHVTGNSIITNSNIYDSWVGNAVIQNSRILDSSIDGDYRSVKIEIKSCQVEDITILHNLSDTDNPITITTQSYYVQYSGFEMVNGKKVHYVSAGCQDHSVEDWLNNNIRTKIMRANGFPKNREQEFLHYLQAIIARHCGK